VTGKSPNFPAESLGWQLLFPVTVTGIARSNSITVAAVILSITAVILKKKQITVAKKIGQ